MLYKRCFTHYFHMKTKLLTDFQICISAPVSDILLKGHVRFWMQIDWILLRIFYGILDVSEAASGGDLWKQVFLKSSQILQENPYVGVSFLFPGHLAYNIIKTRHSKQLLYCEISEIIKNIYCTTSTFVLGTNTWDKVFKSELSKFCGRQPLKNFKGYGLFPWNFLKVVFHKTYLVHTWILCPNC